MTKIVMLRPLKKAADAFELDTTNYTLDEVENIVVIR